MVVVVVVVVVAFVPSMVTGLYMKNLRVSLSAVWMLTPGISTTFLFLLRVTALSLLSMVIEPAVASTVLMVIFSYCVPALTSTGASEICQTPSIEARLESAPRKAFLK